MIETETIPQLRNAREAKKFFSSCMKEIFLREMKPRSKYAPGDIIRVIRNAIFMKEYVETYVRNSTLKHNPSGDTIFRMVKGIAVQPITIPDQLRKE
ncbi:MAG: hypothetical protein ACYCWK_10335 [Cuniculiplasma sp.]